MRAEVERAQTEARLVDLRITGDAAEGKQSISFQGRSLEKPIHFRKIDGKWYMHQPDLFAGQGAESGAIPGREETGKAPKGQ